jgi:formylglycine-generating enzyme required for sulfatase activity
MSLSTGLTAVREILTLDRTGRPACPDRALLHRTICGLRAHPEMYDDLVTTGFLAGAADRRAEHVERLLHVVPAGGFTMGTEPAKLRHFCGEAPAHHVELPAFMIARTEVTRELLGLFTPLEPGAPDLPVVDVSWYDATVFALWMGCRLPTEAEWEYACGGGEPGEWCCADATDLSRYAWFSENAGGRPHQVGGLRPNRFGLYDLHGNVWEWCHDDYADDFYARSPRSGPVNDSGRAADDPTVHKVVRGGGFHALTEMCRTRFRLHDPAYYRACDLGFRLAGDPGSARPARSE